MITVTILKDITPPRWSTFHRRSSRIEYDAKNPMAHKRHALIFQQGDRYGEIGDKCTYLSHAELLDLERRGYVRISGRASRPAEVDDREAAGIVSNTSVLSSKDDSLPLGSELPATLRGN